MKPQKALHIAVKVLYVMPAVLWDMMTLLLIVPLASWQGIFPIFWLYPTLPTVAAVLLWKGKWWGGIPGIAMGVMLMTLVPSEEVSGLSYCLYFAVMGLICCLTSRKKEEEQ